MATIADVVEIGESPEPLPPCACRRHKFDVIQINEGDKRKGGEGVWTATLQITCKDCGKVLAHRNRDGYDTVARLVYGPDLEEKLAAAREKRAETAERTQAEAAKKTGTTGDPQKGLPGTEMLQVTSELGIETYEGCGCKSVAAAMDVLGVEGCRRRRNELILQIDAGLEGWGWSQKLKAATAAMWKAVGMGVSVTDPVVSLFEISVDRAEKKAKALAG
jgi:hypothetical protein